MTSTADLTQGPIRRQMISLALPLLASNILQQLYNTVDVAIIGRYVNGEAFAAVGMAGSVMNLFLFLITGGCNGTGVLFSQFRGAGDDASFRREFFLVSVFGGGLSLGLTGLALFTLAPLLALLRTPEELLLPASSYLRVIFLGFLPSFVYQLGFTVLRSIGRTGAALWFLMISMAANLALDAAFVAGLRWGSAGAGDARRSREGFFTGERLLAALGLAMSALMIAGAVPALSAVLPGDSGPEVLAQARGYLHLVACFYLFNFLGSGIVGYFQGRGRVNLPVIGAAGHITLRVVLSAALAPRMGLPAVALATGLGWVGVVSCWSFPLRKELRRDTPQI